MNYKLEAFGGSNFNDVAKEAKKIAYEKTFDPENEQIVEFDFNGITCLVDWSTNLEWLYRDYMNAHLMGWETIGSKCLSEYGKKTIELMKKKKAAAIIEADKRNAEYNSKCANERAAFVLKTEGVKIELTNVEGWNKSRDNNKDPYDKATLDYAEGWAKLMQLEIDKGGTVEECQGRTSFELGFMGISGTMYGFAKGLLKQCWKYGDELK